MIFLFLIMVNTRILYTYPTKQIQQPLSELYSLSLIGI